jgi:hypothetical protein
MYLASFFLDGRLFARLLPRNVRIAMTFDHACVRVSTRERMGGRCTLRGGGLLAALGLRCGLVQRLGLFGARKTPSPQQG